MNQEQHSIDKPEGAPPQVFTVWQSIDPGFNLPDRAPWGSKVVLLREHQAALAQRDAELERLRAELARVKADTDQFQQWVQPQLERLGHELVRVDELTAKCSNMDTTLGAYINRERDMAIKIAELTGKCERVEANNMILRGGNDQLLQALAAYVCDKVKLQAKCWRLEAEHETALGETIDERDDFEAAITLTHIALGGSGDWTAKLPPEDPPNSGNLRVDLPVLARERFEKLQQLQTASQELNRASAQLLEFVDRYCEPSNGRGLYMADMRAALREEESARSVAIEQAVED